MGQVEDREDVRQDSRGRAEGQEVRRNLAALGGAVLALLAACALAACQSPSQPPQISKAVSPQSRSASLKFDQKLAWAHLIKQTDFGPRVPGTPEHIKCRDWIAEEMKKHCTNVRLQEFSHNWSYNGKKVTMWNVVGEQNWERAKTRVLLLAHWDTRPYANEDPNPANQKKPVLGANDGASGVAVLLELMRALKDRNPDLGIMYLMTDGEDIGPGLDEMFLGAVHFSKNMPSPKPEYGILIDMVGSKNVRIPMETNSFGYAPDLMRAFYRNAQQNGLAKTFPAEYGSAIMDDHITLNQAGLKTIDLIDFTHLDHWHTVTDTPENCSADSLGAVGKALESWLVRTPPFKIKL